MKNLFYRPLFWISFIATSCIAAFLALHFFPHAISIVNVPITMDRYEAIEHAHLIAQSHKLTPTEGHTAVNFQTDFLVQFFVELDAGGKPAFEAMIKDDLYQPYTWQIRFFQEHEAAEALVAFTSNGTPYGFKQQFSENLPGAQLEAEQARAIAQQGAKSWNIDFTHYTLIESAKEVVPSGRIDHTFVYERPEKIGTGFYRLRLKVAGDVLSELTHFVQVPESFIQKYTEMRSANDAIAYYAKIALMLLYFLGCCLFGLFFLAKRRYILWRAPMIWGLIFIFLSIGTGINQLPLAWMQYDTAVSSNGYLIQYIVSILITSCAMGMFFTIIFAAAESLTRYAFGNHIQFWATWEKGIANSFQVLGRTVGAYLVVPLFLAYALLFYLIMNNYFGWWSPASSLFDPNVLATYLPWFDPLSQSIRAGFWEECMFRAVPLSCAAILGNHFGKRNWWIAGAMIAQALIFGAGHANYATQPAIARVVELFVTSLMFGGLYLAFGLMTAIITHIIFDVFWFALPIFIASGSETWMNKGMIILGSLIPLIIILVRRAQQGEWRMLAVNALNLSWRAPEAGPAQRERDPQLIIAPFSWRTTSAILALGIASLGIWYWATPYTQQAAPLNNLRADALATAQHAFAQINIDQQKPWTPLITVYNTFETNPELQHQHRFIWQIGGPTAYQSLLGSYLQSPYWQIRFAQFEGPLADRAEEIGIAVNGYNKIIRILHKLPEDREGKDLSEQAARAIAHAAIANKFGLDAQMLKEISATATKRPARKDWCFIFSDENAFTQAMGPYSAEGTKGKQALRPGSGQARVCITISGDQVTDANRFIQVPEEWERAEKDNDNMRNIIMLICIALIYLIFCVGCLLAALGWSHTVSIGKSFVASFVAILALQMFGIFNKYTDTLATNFNTSQPFQDQWIRNFGSLFFKAFFMAAALGLLIAYLNRFTIRTRIKRTPWILGIGLAIGVIFAAAQAVIVSAIPSLKPLWAHYTSVAAWSPLLDYLSNAILSFISLTLLCILMFTIIDFVTQQGSRRIFAALPLTLLFGIALSGAQYADNPLLLLASGIALGILFFGSYYLVLRHDFALIPLAVAGFMVLQHAQQYIYTPFPATHYATAESMVLIIMLATQWAKYLNCEKK